MYNVAVIATARKLVTIAYLMLKTNEPYRYAKPDVVRRKLTECRGKAQLPPVKPAKASRAADGESPLGDLYGRHGLPACQPPARWSAGERRALEAAEVMPFAASVHQPAPKPKRRPPTAKTTK